MNRRAFILLAPALILSACMGSGGSEVTYGSDGKPLPRVYRITPDVAAQIPYRLLDSLNTLRRARGVQPLQLNAYLTAAAETHARDMSVQNRPWHFGSDGSSPLSRVQRTGYSGRLMGENISETYQTELETLSAWMESPDQRAILMDGNAREIGLGWYQEENGKIWWTLVTGG